MYLVRNSHFIAISLIFCFLLRRAINLYLMSELVLHEAAASGDYHELESLLMMGRIDVNFKDEEVGDRTARHWAAARGTR